MSEPLRDDAGPAPEATVHTDPAAAESVRPDPTAVESLISALLESGPEVAEHVVNAAKELLLAAQTIVEAAEKAVQEQQELRNRPAETPPTTDGPAPLRHLDVAE